MGSFSLGASAQDAKKEPEPVEIIGGNGKKIIEIRESQPTNVTLMESKPENPEGYRKLSYNYFTSLEEYEDGTSANFLMSELRLSDLETATMEDAVSSIRITLGWRNPQEDAYDFSGINIMYYKDTAKLKFSCVDGYGFGSYSTKTITNTVTGTTIDGSYNQTVKDWTDNIGLDELKLQYRNEEIQDCEIITEGTYGTERPDFGENQILGVQPN